VNEKRVSRRGGGLPGEARAEAVAQTPEKMEGPNRSLIPPASQLVPEAHWGHGGTSLFTLHDHSLGRPTGGAEERRLLLEESAAALGGSNGTLRDPDQAAMHVAELTRQALAPAILTDRTRHSQPALVAQLRGVLDREVVGQQRLKTQVLVSLLSGGHLFIEGPPGVAKTTVVETIGKALDAPYGRIGGTHDVLPSDIIGTDVLDPSTHQLRFVPTQLFRHIVLLDEINRLNGKAQEALLEPGQKGRVTTNSGTHDLPAPYIWYATLNPHVPGSTLVEAVADRFAAKIIVPRPTVEEDYQILKLEGQSEVTPVATIRDLAQAREEVSHVHVDDSVLRYIIQFPHATRSEELKEDIQVGAGTRAAQALIGGARALAYMEGRRFVLPEDVEALAPDYLRHRLTLNYGVEDLDGVLAKVMDVARRNSTKP
jgi:MoxR-like ATPase